MAKNRNRTQQSTNKESTMDNNQTAEDQVTDTGVEGVEEVKQDVTDTTKVGISLEEAVQDIQAGQDQLAEEIYQPAAVQEPVVIPAGQAKATPVLDDVNQLPLSCDASSRLVIEEIKHYIEKMSSRAAMPAEEGGQMQTHLYHTLLQAINTKAEDFEAVFGLTMKLIRDNLKGVFSDENMHRYTPHVTMPQARVVHFRQLLSTLTALAAPQTRQLALRHGLEHAFGRAPIREESRQRVLNFFNV